MATVYSLVCWAGKSTAVTLDATNDRVTWNNHGCRQYNGGTTKMVKTGKFGGTVPSPLNNDDLFYFDRYDDNNLNIYSNLTDATAGTNKLTFTSAGTSVTIIGGYFAGLTTAQKLRYGAAGSERIFGDLLTCRADRYTNALANDLEHIELGDAFYNYPAATDVFTCNIPCDTFIISPTVNGQLTEAFHNGIYGAGFEFMCRSTAGYLGAIYVTRYNVTVWGFTVKTSGTNGLQPEKPGGNFYSMFFVGTGSGSVSGIHMPDVLSKIHHNVFVSFGYGMTQNNYRPGGQTSNNIFAKSVSYGMYVLYAGGTINGFFNNNIVIGSGTANYFTEPSGVEGATNNSGETGDAVTPWETAGGSRLIVDEADFIDYANNDFRPALESSPQVGTGISISSIDAIDLAGKICPAMIDITHDFDYDNEADGPFVTWDLLSWGSGGTAGTGRLVELTDSGTTGQMRIHLISGVAPTDDLEITNGTATCDVNGTVTELDPVEWVASKSWSAGAIEYDYGGPQALVTLTIGPVDSETEIRIMEAGTDTEITGIEQVGETGYFEYEYPYSGTPVSVDINIIHVSKKNIFLEDVSLGATDQSIYVTQGPDRSYENPT